MMDPLHDDAVERETPTANAKDKKVNVVVVVE